VLLLLLAGTAGGTWWLWQRNQAITAAEEAVAESLKLRGEGDWAGALASARRATLLLPPAAVPADLRQRIAAAQVDAKMAGTLDAIRMARADRMENDHFGPSREEAQFESAFREYGVDVAQANPQDLAEQVRRSSIRDHLVFALDAWARARLQKEDPVGAGRLLAIASQVDPDPWRQAARHPDPKRDELHRLARMPEALDQPPSCLALLADALGRMADSPLAAVDLLEAAQRKHPGDFWLNHELAFYLEELNPPRSADAVGFFRAALALRPNSPGVHHNLGRSLGKLGQLAEAESCFRRAIALQEDYSFAHNNLAAVLLQRGQRDEAEAHLRKAIASNPNNANAHTNMALLLEAKGDHAGAIRWYRETARLAPTASNHRKLGLACYQLHLLPEAITALRKAVRLGPLDVGALSNLGLALSDAGNQEEALAALDAAICLRPEDPIVLKNRGLVCARMGRHDEAIAHFREAIRLRPADAQAFNNLSVSLLVRGLAQKSRVAAEQALKIDPKQANAHFNLGRALSSLGRTADAVAAFRRAATLKPGWLEALQHLAEGLAQLGRWPETINVCREALKLGPDHVPTLMNLGVALMEQNQLDAGALELTRAVRLAPHSAVAHANLGVARMRQQRWAEAERHLRHAVRLDREAANARCDLGTVLLQRGAYREAVVHLSKAIALNPKFVDAYLDQGRALRGGGDFSGAMDALERGLALLEQKDPRRSRFEQEREQARQLLRAERKLPAILAGKAEPADTNERLLLAYLCQRYLDRHATAARFYTEALRDAKLSKAAQPGLRYNAACSAARAAAGLGKDAGDLDNGARAQLRRQALDWLETELASWKKIAGSPEKQVREQVPQAMRSWLEDDDLAGARRRSALEKLPAEERKSWQALWGTVRDLARAR
jgi:tetratricopeptide (TPR) repeat protein